MVPGSGKEICKKDVSSSPPPPPPIDPSPFKDMNTTREAAAATASVLFLFVVFCQRRTKTSSTINSRGGLEVRYSFNPVGGRGLQGLRKVDAMGLEDGGGERKRTFRGQKRRGGGTRAPGRWNNP